MNSKRKVDFLMIEINDPFNWFNVEYIINICLNSTKSTLQFSLLYGDEYFPNVGGGDMKYIFQMYKGGLNSFVDVLYSLSTFQYSPLPLSLYQGFRPDKFCP